MTSTRFLLPGVVLAVFAGPSLAQFGRPGASYPGLVPSVRPAAGEEPLAPRPQTQPLPPGRPPAAVASLEGMAIPPAPGSEAHGDPVGTLTGQPTYPVGSYPSPYYVDGPGCCGPLGANGRIGYELYSYTGVNFVFGGGLPEFLNAGWTVGSHIRTLFFDASHTAAWTLDYGLSYTHNWGQGSEQPVNLFIRQTAGDRQALSGIRAVHRTSFNFAVGRDVWVMGAGNVGGMQPEGTTNCRLGGWVGGRYGTAHVDIDPLDEINGYARRQNVYHGFQAGAHASFDRSMGGWVLFGGARVEYGYDWTNIVPPYQGNLHNVNVQLTLGIRY